MAKIFIIFGFLAAVIGGGIWYVATRGSGTIAAEQEASKQVANMFSPVATESPSPSPREIDAAPAAAASPITNTNESTSQKIMHATLHTSKGDIEIEFFDTLAPNTVANFTKLAGSGFYDGTRFHRVIKGFMIQGGDPFSKDDTQMARWGTGGPGYTFADEIHAGNKNSVGTVAMANAGPNTNGSQFFINVANNNFLDTKHTVFGRVIKGADVVYAIESSPTGQSDRPVEPITITSIDLK